jgi:hypothetical protein
MGVRLTTAIVLTGLAFAIPVRAEVDILNPEEFLGAQEAQTSALLAVDLARLQSPVSSTLVATDQSVSMAESGSDDLAGLHSEPVSPAASVSLTPAGTQVEEASLSPEIFLDSHEDETLVGIAVDLASSAELTTGTIAHGSAEAATLPADQTVAQSLTDDALPFEEYLLP